MGLGRFHLPLLLIGIAILLPTIDATNATGYLCPLPGCPKKFDVVVILDRSIHVKKIFPELVQLIKDIIHLFDIREGSSHFGLLLYSKIAEVKMKLNEKNNIAFIKQYLMKSLPEPYGRRNLDRALREVRRQILTPAMGDRDYTPNVCIILTTERRLNANPQFQLLKRDCEHVIVLRNGNAADLVKVRRRVCPLAIVVQVSCERKICCQNGGTPIQAINGCCKCKCQPNFSGRFCEDITRTEHVSRETYQNGRNPAWVLEVSSTDNKYPIQQTLKSKTRGSGKFGSFNRNDRKPTFSIWFRGRGKFLLHSLSVHFLTKIPISSVTITYIIGKYIIDIEVIHLVLRRYTIFERNLYGRSVTKVKFTFNGICRRRGCFGINELYATYTQIIDEEPNCNDHRCLDMTIPRLHEHNGCCKCNNITTTTYTPTQTTTGPAETTTPRYGNNFNRLAAIPTPPDTGMTGCDSSPCENGGTCNNGINGFNCICPAGFTGSRCDTDVNECGSSPCVNGECVNGINSFNCTCPPGFTGTVCDMGE